MVQGQKVTTRYGVGHITGTCCNGEIYNVLLENATIIADNDKLNKPDSSSAEVILGFVDMPRDSVLVTKQDLIDNAIADIITERCIR